MKKKIKDKLRCIVAVATSLILAAVSLSGCGVSGDNMGLDPKNPVTITVWHYYNGTILDAFDVLVKTFNETAGREKGIIVENYAYGSVSELEKAVLASANKEVGSAPVPNVFASYADTAYAVQELGILIDLNKYFSAD